MSIKSWEQFIEQFPVHAAEYREQIAAIDPVHMDAPERERSVGCRIMAHTTHPENWPGCAQCKEEPINLDTLPEMKPPLPHYLCKDCRNWFIEGDREFTPFVLCTPCLIKYQASISR